MTQDKILELPELTAALAEHRARGRKIILANGCFDVLHVGHVRYLQGAKALGDILVVAVNSDDSMRRIKDPGRPLMAEAARARLVAAVAAVDYVIVFSDSTVGPLLEALRPNVHAKGTDYTVDTVPEREVVRAWGGSVAIVGDPKHHSSREVIRQVLKKCGAGN